MVDEGDDLEQCKFTQRRTYLDQKKVSQKLVSSVSDTVTVSLIIAVIYVSHLSLLATAIMVFITFAELNMEKVMRNH